ncbi:MAG: hypothetical protein A4E61_01253 [Syntrophorhabdus sp. PtaB.Bin184]|nr:MAG: hypothetical protein A4E61_01253 [Syntrophorhabdus sp. PtaB.Bin184]
MRISENSCIAGIGSALTFIGEIVAKLGVHYWPRYTAVPVDQCYWVVPGRLLAQSRPVGTLPWEQQRRFTNVLEAGIRHVIDLTPDGSIGRGGSVFNGKGERDRCVREAGSGLTFSVCPIQGADSRERDRMVAILDEIDRCMAFRKPVYIHCRAGQETADTVVGCYLARHAFASAERIFDILHGLREDREETARDRLSCSGHSEMVLSWNIGE